MEQLLHVTAHAERMSTLDALLLAPAVSAGEAPPPSPPPGPSALLIPSVSQIVNEPPPLWEVPSNCNNFTAQVFRAGLRKDPERRASATALRRKTTKALRAGELKNPTFVCLFVFNACSFVTCLTAEEKGCYSKSDGFSTVGGLSPGSVRTACEQLCQVALEDSSSCPSSPELSRAAEGSAPAVLWVSPWRTTAVDEDGSDGGDFEEESGESEPRSLQAEEDWDHWTDSEVDLYTGEDDCSPEKGLKTDGDYEGDWEEDGDEDEEEWSPTGYLQALTDLFPLLQKCQPAASCGSEKELEYLREGESDTAGPVQENLGFPLLRGEAVFESVVGADT